MSNDLNPDQRALLGHVAMVEQGLGANTIDIDENGNPKEPEPTVDAAEENKMILGLLIGLLSPALPFLPQVYTPEVIERIANAYTAVEAKYGWNVRGMMGVEMQLAIVAIPPTVQAVVLGKMYFEAKKRDAEKVINPEEGRDAGNQ